MNIPALPLQARNILNLLGEVWHIQSLCGKIPGEEGIPHQIWNIPNLSGEIWNIPNPPPEVWNIPDLPPKVWNIPDLVPKVRNIPDLVPKVWNIPDLCPKVCNIPDLGLQEAARNYWSWNFKFLGTRPGIFQTLHVYFSRTRARSGIFQTFSNS